MKYSLLLLAGLALPATALAQRPAKIKTKVKNVPPAAAPAKPLKVAPADHAILMRVLPTAICLATPVSAAGLRAALAAALPGRRPDEAPGAAEASSRETILRFDQHIFLKHNYQYVRLTLADIVLLEADNTTTNVVTTGPHYALRLSLTAVLERLCYPPLVRVHRSYAINLHHLTTFSDTEATLHDQTVPLGRQYKADFLRHFQYH